jgi:hypothetical protein
MHKQILKDTITQLFAGSKGLLAIDENTCTCNKRFAATDIPQTIEIRRKYRELIVTTPGLNESPILPALMKPAKGPLTGLNTLVQAMPFWGKALASTNLNKFEDGKYTKGKPQYPSITRSFGVEYKVSL